MSGSDNGYTLFPTALGPCGIAWGATGIVATALPASADAATRAWLRRRAPNAVPSTPPPHVAEAIDGIQRLLRGERIDLSRIALDMADASPLHLRVWQAARTIPPGRTLTYGEVATAIGEPGGAREVGQALGANPFPIIVPCHRVLAAKSRAGGFSAPGGTRTKLRMLEIERAAFAAEPGLFDV